MNDRRVSIAGRLRLVTDDQVFLLREWKTFKALCDEIGISTTHGSRIRNGYFHKQASP